MFPLSNDPVERARALGLGLQARRARAAIKRQLRAGQTSFSAVLAKGTYGQTDEIGDHARVAGRMKVGEVLRAVKGVGPVHAGRVLAAAGLNDPRQRLDTLSAAERDALLQALIDHGFQ